MGALLTVVEPAATHDLTTLATVKAELGITGTSADTLLAAMIRQASDAAARYCNRIFGQERVREVFRLERPQDCLILARTPIVTVHWVNEGGTDLTPAEHVESDTGAGLLYRLAADARRPWCGCKVVVEYTGGFDLSGSDVPRELERAALALVKGQWHARDRDPALRSQTFEGTGAESFTTSPAMDTEAARMLDQFRHPVNG